MSIIPIVRAIQPLAVLARAGFVVVRQTGSHIRLKNYRTGRTTTIPIHSKDLTRKMTSTILKQAGISVSKFLKLLK